MAFLEYGGDLMAIGLKLQRVTLLDTYMFQHYKY